LPPNKNEIHKKTGKYVLEKAINFISWGIIDFEDSISVKKEEMKIENWYSVITYISPFFLKDIIFKLWNYYSRQWSPDLFNFSS
jgi:hypothetical protein